MKTLAEMARMIALATAMLISLASAVQSRGVNPGRHALWAPA